MIIRRYSHPATCHTGDCLLSARWTVKERVSGCLPSVVEAKKPQRLTHNGDDTLLNSISPTIDHVNHSIISIAHVYSNRHGDNYAAPDHPEIILSKHCDLLDWRAQDQIRSDHVTTRQGLHAVSNPDIVGITDRDSLARQTGPLLVHQPSVLGSHGADTVAMPRRSNGPQ
ncbi:hypothetical protein ASPWEDRAFT_36689 [Aspergillus wentii DTO 134E9]|uniref:Uncharacterized protein n=1 Tax=Aspergillus wentii DTO 134E9 TaxID=1073089 RepID=A0A1L9RVM6_ASPWE|nr:uncharacterized protein ASPWEDRAFT_36689 [Aspergillus wentii DTO 134E9]OJJ38979.1 hypothetical protein ASPWEDRAFT_36689 [Aspergillus wentii DTO 134E9]